MEISNDSLSTSVQICALCSKTFIQGKCSALESRLTMCLPKLTLASSYARHVTYCRRTQYRPRRRPRSCFACSVAKTKCSFNAPCARCTRKGLDCAYESSDNSRSMQGAVCDTDPRNLDAQAAQLDLATVSSNAECLPLQAFRYSSEFQEDTWYGFEDSLIGNEFGDIFGDVLNTTGPPLSSRDLTMSPQSNEQNTVFDAGSQTRPSCAAKRKSRDRGSMRDS